jgi:hypothetical protein
MIENVDYQMIPVENQEYWNIRILTGEYVETIFNFGAVKINSRNESLHFNFNIISSPIDYLTNEDTGLQKCVSSILYSVLESSTEDVIKENDEQH